MDFGYLNLGSLLFGLIAWGLPVFNLIKQNKAENKKWILFSLSSLISCSISLCMQIRYQNHLVIKEDWSALMDTSSMVALVSSILLCGTVALNIITLVKYKDNKQG